VEVLTLFAQVGPALTAAGSGASGGTSLLVLAVAVTGLLAVLVVGAILVRRIRMEHTQPMEVPESSTGMTILPAAPGRHRPRRPALTAPWHRDGVEQAAVADPQVDPLDDAALQRELDEGLVPADEASPGADPVAGGGGGQPVTAVAPPTDAVSAAPAQDRPAGGSALLGDHELVAKWGLVTAPPTAPDAAPEAEEAVQAPGFAEPVFPEPVFAEPVFAEPVFAEPVFAELAVVELAAVESAAVESAYADPAAEQPVYVDPAFAEPVFTDPTAAEPQYAEPTTYPEPQYTEPHNAESQHAEPQHAEPPADEAAFADPAVADPVPDEPVDQVAPTPPPPAAPARPADVLAAIPVTGGAMRSASQTPEARPAHVPVSVPAPRESGPSADQMAVLRANHRTLLGATKHLEVAAIAASGSQQIVEAARAAFVERTVDGPRVSAESPAARRLPGPWTTLFPGEAPWDSGARFRAVIPDDALEVTPGTAVIAVPVPASGRVLGALVARRGGDRPFSPGDEDALARFGRLVGAAADRTSRTGVVHLDPEAEGRLRDSEQLLTDLRGALRVSMPPARPVALVVVGLGHTAILRAGGRGADADALLRRIVQRIEDSVRPGDQVYRWRADELAVMLPETARGQAVRVTIRLRNLVTEMIVEDGGSAETIQLGWAIGDSLSAAKLVQRARTVMTPAPAARKPVTRPAA